MGRCPSLWAQRAMAITVDPNEPFHVLLGGQVTPVSLEVLDALYQDDTIEEATLIWQQGLGGWLRLDAVLAELEKQEPPAPQQREVEPDSYYVSFGDSDVRLLSLDQLDKFFDLEVIDSSTLVWQPGFTEWVPLAVLIGEGDAPPVSIHPSLGPQQSASQQPAAQQSAPRPPTATVPAFSAPAPVGFSSPSSRPAPASQQFSAPAPVGFSSPSSRPAPVSQQPAAAFAQTLSAPPGSVPPGSAPPGSVRHAPPSARPQSVLPAPSLPPTASGLSSRPASLGPSMQYSLAPNSLQEPGALTLSALPQPPKASPWFGRGLLAATLFAGLFVVQRNGVMMDLARGAGQGSSWQKVEASMGGTSLDTPQGVSAWLSDLSTRHGLASLTPTEPLEPAAARQETVEAAPAFKLTPLPAAAPAATTPGAASGPTNRDPKATDIAEKMRLKLAGESERPAPQARAVSRPSSKPTGSKKKKSSSSDAYDPMNGTL